MGTIRAGGHPADADLVFEISFGVQAVNTGLAPRFCLLILDPKMHFTLWTLTEHISWATLLSNRDKDFDQGMTNLVSDLKKLASRDSSVANAATK